MRLWLIVCWLVPLTRTAQRVPSAPLNLNVELIGATEVRLSWEKPERPNGVLHGYYVYKEKLENGHSTGEMLKGVTLNDPNKLWTNLSSLEPNQEYAFRVNAFNRNGDGEFSDRKIIVTGGLPPRRPEIEKVSLLRDEKPIVARIAWSSPTSSPNDPPIERYNILYRQQGRREFSEVNANGDALFVDINNLLMGQSYEVVVRAMNSEGFSVNATELLSTPVGEPDAEPLNVRYEIIQGQVPFTMRLSWDPPAEDRRNGNITRYQAVLTPMDSDGETAQKEVSTGWADFAVDPKKSYTFKVRASTMKGWGPHSPVLTINPNPAGALVGPPTNVRVEAISNSSVVVQWDFEDDQKVDGFVVKSMHEPGIGFSNVDRWKVYARTSPDARHFIVSNLLAHKQYAFCVLAVSDRRQGACSDPPVTIEKLSPVYILENIHVIWKTPFSVKFGFTYNGPEPVLFYYNQTGIKEYQNQDLELKTLVSTGIRNYSNNTKDTEPFFTNLRPYTNYTFEFGVASNITKTHYWPVTFNVTTDPTGPPLVPVPIPEGDQSVPGQRSIRLSPATEEYGPISHYWLVVVPGNTSHEDVNNVEPNMLEAQTRNRKISGETTKKLKRSHPEESSGRTKRGATPHAYITAQILGEDMKAMKRQNRAFSLGDNRDYNGFVNHRIDSESVRLFLRAFAAPEVGRKPHEFRPPTTDRGEKSYSDSLLSEPLHIRSSHRGSSTSMWLVGPVIALLIIALLIGMLVWWWVRCNKKSVGRGSIRHGSITKVALAGHTMNNGNAPSERCKLLPNDYQRNIMHPYEQMNGNVESSMDLYPFPNGTGVLSGVLSGGAVAGHQLSHPAVPITELAMHIERLRANNNAGFQTEFESIETGQQFTWEHSSADCNKHKNRYANVVAYDHSRVILSSDGIPGMDYINANYIDGYDKPRAYIATQGPLPETFDDFWRMVWEEGSSTIVMLTNLEERQRVKCDQYWPSRGSALYGDVEVQLVDTTVLAHYTMRTMRLTMAGESDVRDIKHLQYTAWPDHGVPDHPTPFLVFLKRVKTLNPVEAGPIVSHCSAGIGRTGAFIVIDCMLERLRYENTVDIFGCVTALRSQRSYMVQTEDQYVFIHDAVLDAVNSGSTEVPAKKLNQHVQALMQPTLDNVNGIELEFRHLTAIRVANSRCMEANHPVNRHKNKMMNAVPFDSNRVVLAPIPGIDGSDYINASWIDGYRERGAYIATQAPLDSTVVDFWRMCWQHEAGIIVMLKSAFDGKRVEYWPDDKGVQIGQIVIEPIAEYNMPQYILREFKCSDIQSQMTRTIRQFEYTEWPESSSAPKNADLFIDFIQQVHRTKTQFGVDGPIVVHCSTGAGRSGVFIGLSQIIDRIRLEHVIDVFTTVKLLRTERQGMVSDKEEYQFLYLAAREFLAAYDPLI